MPCAQHSAVLSAVLSAECRSASIPRRGRALRGTSQAVERWNAGGSRPGPAIAAGHHTPGDAGTAGGLNGKKRGLTEDRRRGHALG